MILIEYKIRKLQHEISAMLQAPSYIQAQFNLKLRQVELLQELQENILTPEEEEHYNDTHELPNNIYAGIRISAGSYAVYI